MKLLPASIEIKYRKKHPVRLKSNKTEIKLCKKIYRLSIHVVLVSKSLLSSGRQNVNSVFIYTLPSPATSPDSAAPPTHIDWVKSANEADLNPHAQYVLIMSANNKAGQIHQHTS